ncbi:carbamoyltransferase family protein [Streptacidiphilus cavernicola]|uniref:Carbamoyltransferase n=1 Tax=Streptacidiphilus cavernicola TaxID=3342716 RepID=A0ABV6VYB3_9ACTN
MGDNPVAVGLNLGHDGGCAIVSGDQVVAVAEERLNRTRYSSGWQAALAYCLDAADLHLADVDQVVFSNVGPRLPDGFTGGLDRYGVDPAKIRRLDHHASHAYSAFCLSGAEQALVVVADGSGNDHQTESYFCADRNGLERIGGNRADRGRAGGIGATYEAVTNWIGFDGQESGKIMALASYGDPKAIDLPLFDLVGNQVEGRLPRTHDRGLAAFAADHALDLGTPYAWGEQRARDLAAWVQAQTEDALVGVVEQLVAEYCPTTVCLAGGVAMNCVANEAVRARTGAPLFVPPPASDRGQALGNALHGIHRLTGRVPSLPLADRDSFGRSYSDEEIHLALRRHPMSGLAERHPHRPFTFHRESDAPAVAAELLADGKLIAWFDGGSELGARALGSRSILADPRHEATRDVLNTRVKHREYFRPFAPAVLTERATGWFDLAGPSPYMLFAPRVRADRRDQLGAVTHVDGTARVQTVDRAAHPAFHRLISGFEARTGVPVVLNTSFNDTEPIVESPADAVATFCRTDLDALVFGNGYIAVKADG